MIKITNSRRFRRGVERR